MSKPPIGDGWYESEQSTRAGMVVELQRIRNRTRVRPLPVLLLAAIITAGVAYKFAAKKRLYEADVVLALSEGSLDVQGRAIPYEQLRDYVFTVLLPDSKLLELIERRDLHRLRKKLGNEYALEQLRGQLEVEIWKNSFVYYDEEAVGARKSARIGLTVMDEDADEAIEIARDIAAIIMQTHDEQRQKLADQLAHDVDEARITLAKREDIVTKRRAELQKALSDARAAGNNKNAAGLLVDLATFDQEDKRLREQLSQIATSPEAFADRITKARLGTTLEIVEERRPLKHEQSGLVLVMIIVVIGTGALLGAALFVGAFDSRVHDTDDVARLDLPVLGHVPGFSGDHVGSLEARGVMRRRVPSFLRWRLPR